MKKTLFALTGFLCGAALALAAPADRWLHIKVDEGGEKAERVRVNVPLELAEKVLPTIQTDKLKNGKMKITEAKFNGVDLRAVLDAVRSAKDNEFVTVESEDEKVRVAKSGGNLLAKVREEKGEKSQVDVSVPFTVIDALLSAGKDELDLVAAVRALGAVGDTVLVTVNDGKSQVRIWVDSKNASE